MSNQNSFQVMLPDIEDDHEQNVAWEGELLGIYLTGHPLEACGIKFEEYPSLTEATEDREDQWLKLPVLCVKIVPKKTRNGKRMGFIMMEDGYMARCKGVLFPWMWSRAKPLLEDDCILYIAGKVNSFNGEVNLIIQKLARRKGDKWLVAG